MKLLATLNRNPGITPHGRTVTRRAVRAIIQQENALLMIYSPINGDYKFPGGGVKRGETLQAALRREVREESGLQVTDILAGFGRVIEYDRALQPGFDLFRMTSYYYICQVGEGCVPLALDDYESDLEFTPRWVSVTDALAANRAVLTASEQSTHPWTHRETLVLELLEKERPV